MVDLKIVDMAVFRKVFWNFFVPAALILFTSILLVVLDIRFTSLAFQLGFKNVFLYGIIIITALFTVYLSRQRTKLNTIQNFEERLAFLTRYYRLRITWYLLSTSIAALLYLLVANRVLLIFAIFELVMFLLAFPTKEMLMKEMDEKDLLIR